MAKFDFKNLDQETRRLMLAEIKEDIKQHGTPYLSDNLNSVGKSKYQEYLIKAVTSGDEETLENLLEISSHFNLTYLRQGKPVKMPVNASTLLSQGEFNRYYIRAICLRAIDEKKENVIVYRARESSRARPESEAIIGKMISADELLRDLRNSIGQEPKLLPEINSGLSVRI